MSTLLSITPSLRLSRHIGKMKNDCSCELFQISFSMIEQNTSLHMPSEESTVEKSYWSHFIPERLLLFYLPWRPVGSKTPLNEYYDLDVWKKYFEEYYMFYRRGLLYAAFILLFTLPIVTFCMERIAERMLLLTHTSLNEFFVMKGTPLTTYQEVGAQFYVAAAILCLFTYFILLSTPILHVVVLMILIFLALFFSFGRTRYQLVIFVIPWMESVEQIAKVREERERMFVKRFENLCNQSGIGMV